MVQCAMDLIDLALQEDLGDAGDVTSEAIFGKETGSFTVTSKDTGILCGTRVCISVCARLDPGITVTLHKQDGDRLAKGDTVASITGRVSSILAAERTALNFLSHLSGIATKTHAFVRQSGGRVRIMDTRKTIPGLRELEKYAVACGGGENHRRGLYDMVLIKDNHIDAAGGITQAVQAVKRRWGDMYFIEVETRNLPEVAEALSCGADRIMLDNMDISVICEAVKRISGRAEIEASGNMSRERIQELADAGVDCISFGELTHTVKAFDFSLKKSGRQRWKTPT